MTANVLLAPYPQFVGKDGYPLNDGYVYIGEPNLAPQDNPKVAYWDEALTIPVNQPIRLSGGYMMHNGTPGRVYTDGVCSMIVLDKRKVFVYQDFSTINLNPLQTMFDERTIRFQSYSALRAYAGGGNVADITSSGIAGRFYVVPGDSSTPDNGGTVVVGSDGRRWRRVESYPLRAEWWGAKGDGVTNDTAAFQATFDAVASMGGGALEPMDGKVYVVRNTTVPSGLLMGAFRIKQLIESEPLDQWAVVKHVFHLENVNNIIFYQTEIDGQRGSQNLDNAGTQDGGCTAWYIAKNCRNIKLVKPVAHHMATDAVELYGWTSDTTLTDGPYDVEIDQPNFFLNRRNNISILSGDGIRVNGGVLATSGVAVSGSQSGATIISGWSSPGIDIEPEAHCRVRNVTIRDTVIDGCRSGWMIYGGSQADYSITDILFDNVSVRSPISGKHFEIAIPTRSDAVASGISMTNTSLYGVGYANIWGGKQITVDGIDSYDALPGGAKSAYSFVASSTSPGFLSLRTDAEVNFSRTTFGNYGLKTNEFSSTTEALINILMDETCFVSPTQDYRGDQTTFGWLLGSRPVQKVSDIKEVPLFRGSAATRDIEPVFYSNEAGAVSGKKSGFVGWAPTFSFSRTTAASSFGSTTLNVSFANASEIGSRVAVIMSSGLWYSGVVTGVPSGTSFTVSPALTDSVNASETAYFQSYIDMYGVSKQPNISNATTGGELAKINAILDALRAANIIGDS